MEQFAFYLEDPTYQIMGMTEWRHFFRLLAKFTETGIWTIYLEELQWLANYRGNLISELKYMWDNFFRHNPHLVLILCGSSPSFMLDQVVHSKALYNRSKHDFHLKEFNLLEAQTFLDKRNNKEIFDAYLTVGGIPEYLKWINKDSSVFLSLCK